jgi:Flp pilus assembly secretin CpaC
MHPTKLARAWAVAGLLAGLVALTGGPARAQEKKESPMATPDRTGAVTVTIGGQVRFQMKSKKPIKEAFNENDRVVQVLADANDPTTLILIGRAAGTSRLDLLDRDGGKESYLVVVQRDVEMLRNLIRKTVPTAMIEITPIGESGNSVILSGYVTSETDRDTIGKLSEVLGLRVAVNTITVGGGGNVPHVQLDLTLAKVDRTRARSRGANFIINGNTVSAGSLLGGLTSLQQGGAAGGAAAAAGGATQSI